MLFRTGLGTVALDIHLSAPVCDKTDLDHTRSQDLCKEEYVEALIDWIWLTAEKNTRGITTERLIR